MAMDNLGVIQLAVSKRETFTDSFDTLVAFDLDQVPGMIATRALNHDRFNGGDFHSNWRGRLDSVFGGRNRSRKESGTAGSSSSRYKRF